MAAKTIGCGGKRPRLPLRKGVNYMKRKLLAAALILTLVCSAFFLFACNKDADKTPTYKDTLPNLKILYEQDNDLKNTYTLLAVNPDKFDAGATNTAGADALIQWLTGEEAYEAIVNFRKAEYGDSLFYRLDNAPVYEGEIAQATEATKTIRLMTTTSVNDSGLLGAIIPTFESDYGYEVNIASLGTGPAINSAKDGNADLIFVHNKASEETFVNEGYSRVVDGYDAERISFIYNFFVLVGPADDPADVENAASVKAAFASIADGEFTFISRGDTSGTHKAEIKLWPTELGITDDVNNLPEGIEGWYISAGDGMGACLLMANEMNGYCLTDKATFLAMKKTPE